ncbi:HTH domain-containing protein [Cellulophaga sp. Z1A5H]|uniref:HTH domain-containing protein n=1 Tax=Cellulophaga sp. Z1A5H TaxID=2687291 RepID=UPI00293C0E5F|nr:HTH domain-containing protein [Cellulophaga sp. Z1A5H]
MQEKRLVTSTSLAEIFRVSVQSIYRDIIALEQAGIPLIKEDKCYTLMRGVDYLL